ncbi:MAG: iron-containing alcohol dehydrogenase, partial [Candidatus Hermodarchaeia archaeon]
MWYFRSPRLIVFGDGALDHLKELEGTRVFVVTDKTIAKLGFLDTVLEKLKEGGKEVAFFDGVTPEPPDTVTQTCAKKVRAFNPDIIIGLGGGSAMDVAKVARILNEHPEHPIIDITPLTTISVSKTTLIAI